MQLCHRQATDDKERKFAASRISRKLNPDSKNKGKLKAEPHQTIQVFIEARQHAVEKENLRKRKDSNQ